MTAGEPAVVAAMTAAAEALHRIASSNQARRIIAAPGKLTEPMLASMRSKVMTEKEIDRLALDTFEMLVIAMRDAAPRIFDPLPSEGDK